MKLETQRLLLRKMDQNDFLELCRILQDPRVMYAYEGPFSDSEVQGWLDNQLRRYEDNDLGLLAVIHKATNQMIRQCGLTRQQWKEQSLLEVGYLLRYDFWHQGYAQEASQACIKYAFEVLQAPQVVSIIRDTNLASQKVALRNAMEPIDTWSKHYRNVDMPHILYSTSRKYLR